MPSVRLTTWKDLIDHLVDWCGSNPAGEVHRDARRASLGGLRDLATAHRWSYYYGRGRINTNAPYSTGTITYTHTGGAAERLVTLDSGTWPAWAANGYLSFDSISYEVGTRISDSQLTLTSASNPGQDVAAGTTYQLVRDTYPMPIDLVSVGMLIRIGGVYPLVFEHPSVWLERQRVYRGPADPRTYCLRGSPDYFGAMAISLFPSPDLAYQLDFIYQRQPRQLRVDFYQTGTVSTTAGSAVVIGAGTNWTSRLVGTVLRVSQTSDYPTGWAGNNAPVCERVVSSVTSTTQLVTDDVVPTTQNAAKYLLSDPVDVEEGAMLTALLRSIEYQMSHARRMKDRAQCGQDYMHAVMLARETDSRNFRDDKVGGSGAYPYRLADMPSGPDT